MLFFDNLIRDGKRACLF